MRDEFGLKTCLAPIHEICVLALEKQPNCANYWLHEDLPNQGERASALDVLCIWDELELG